MWKVWSGRHLCVSFPGLHPEEVVALICIDIFKLRTTEAAHKARYTRKAIDDLLGGEERQRPETPRTYEDIKKRLISGKSHRLRFLPSSIEDIDRCDQTFYL